MSNPLTTPQFVPPFRHVNEILNVAHDRPFSILFANYSWALGVAGGLALLWSVNAWRNRTNSIEHRFTMPIIVALILGGFINVLSEVNQPGRLIYGYIFGWSNWDTSIIKYGIILLPIFLMLAWWLSFQCIPRHSLDREINRLPDKWQKIADVFSLWSRKYSLFDAQQHLNKVLVVMVLLGLFSPLYSAIFLMNEHGIPVWNSPAEALLFLFTSLGVAALTELVFVPAIAWVVTGQNRHTQHQYAWIAAGFLFACSVVWYGWMWWIGRFGAIEDLRAANLFMGPYAVQIFWNWTVLGLFLPIVLILTPLGNARWAQWLALLSAAWGSYAARIGIVLGGEAINRSGAGYLTFHIDSEMLWYTAVGILLGLGILSALLAVMPQDLQFESSSITDHKA